jgi:hypothetical protein
MEISINQANELQDKLKNADQFYLAKSYLIPSDLLAQALNVPIDQLGAYEGIRIYLGAEYSQPVDQAANNNGTITAFPIVIAVDNSGNDIINTEGASGIFYKSTTCPSICPSPNPISSNAVIK